MKHLKPYVKRTDPIKPLPARPIGKDKKVELNGKNVSTLFTYLRNSRSASTAGIPGLSVPFGISAHGLPVEIEFETLAGEDRKLLGLALAAEHVFAHIPPPDV